MDLKYDEETGEFITELPNIPPSSNNKPRAKLNYDLNYAEKEPLYSHILGTIGYIFYMIGVGIYTIGAALIIIAVAAVVLGIIGCFLYQIFNLIT